MTYSTNVPNSSQSPGVFPAQANTNFTRIQQIVNSEHVFNNTMGANDGFHKQMTLINRLTPGAVPADANSMLYSKTVGSNSQLAFYNGTEYILTPPSTISVTNITGNQAGISNGSSYTFFPDPGYQYMGLVFLSYSNSSSFRLSAVVRQGTNFKGTIENNESPVDSPTLSFSGNALVAKNNSGSTQTLVWSLMINRTS